jgi:hypothetical protein
MRSLQGALIIAGVFQAVVGFFGIWRVFIRLVFETLFFFVASVLALVLTLSLCLAVWPRAFPGSSALSRRSPSSRSRAWDSSTSRSPG